MVGGGGTNVVCQVEAGFSVPDFGGNVNIIVALSFPMHLERVDVLIAGGGGPRGAQWVPTLKAPFSAQIALHNEQ